MAPSACLILAAGRGERLSPLGPVKPLVRLDGRPLIEHVMIAASAAGVDRFLIVIGHEADRVREAVRAIAESHEFAVAFAVNARFNEPNGWSVLAARERLPEPHFMTMCDHVLDPAIYSALAGAPRAEGETLLGVDRRLDNPFIDLDDVTRVDDEDGRIRDIGKGLAQYGAYDTGLFLTDSGLCDAIDASMAEDGDASISGGVRHLARQGRAIAVDIADGFWIDVDDPAAHAKAEAHLAGGR